jgi:hypothetical protein
MREAIIAPRKRAVIPQNVIDGARCRGINLVRLTPPDREIELASRALNDPRRERLEQHI